MEEGYEPTAVDDFSEFTRETLYGRDYELDAIILMIVASHVASEVSTFGRLLITGPSGSGKTTVLRLANLLACNAEDVSGATTFGLRATFADCRDTGLSVVLDEIDVIFGPNGMKGSGSQLRSISCRGYEEDATLRFASGQSAVKIPIYAPMFLAGIGEQPVPDDLLTRCVHVTMTKMPDGVKRANSGSPAWKAYAKWLYEPLHEHMRSISDEVAARFPGYEQLNPGLRNRKGEVWGVLFTVADVMGGDWPDRCRMAFERLAMDSGEGSALTPRRSQQVLIDMADVFRAAATETGTPEFLPVRTVAEGMIASKDNGQVYSELAGKRLFMMMTNATGVQATRKNVDDRTVVVRFAADCVPQADKLLAELAPPEAPQVDPDEEELG
jgi:energy-coupling factor transporter ATP-binding protein EcfA2